MTVTMFQYSVHWANSGTRLEHNKIEIQEKYLKQHKGN